MLKESLTENVQIIFCFYQFIYLEQYKIYLLLRSAEVFMKNTDSIILFHISQMHSTLNLFALCSPQPGWNISDTAKNSHSINSALCLIISLISENKHSCYIFNIQNTAFLKLKRVIQFF